MFTNRAEDSGPRPIVHAGAGTWAARELGRQCGGDLGELCLEVNNLEVDAWPGMIESSLAPENPGHAGISCGELVRWMIEDAWLIR